MEMNNFALDQYRRDWLDRHVKAAIGDDAPSYNEFRMLLDQVSREAVDLAMKAGLSPDETGRRSPFDKFLDDAAEPIENLFWSFGSSDDRKKGRMWSHRSFLISDVRGKLLPEFHRGEIEQLAGAYIDAPVKTATVDRLFADLLVGMEFAQFTDLHVNAPHVPFIGPSLLKRKPILDYFANRVVSAVVGLIGFGLFWLATFVGFPKDWLWIVAYILMVLFVLESIWSLLWLPKQWLATRAAQKKVQEIISQMSGVYSALGSDGPISAHHVSDLVRKSSDAGIVWPGPLHVLLEDIIARGGRF